MLTVKGIPKLQPGQKASDGGPRGSGALWVKRTMAGALVFTFRYSVNRRTMDMALGPYDEKGQDGMTLEQARAKAGELQRMIQGGIADPRAWQEEQARLTAEVEAQAKAAAEAAQRAAAEADHYTLAALLRIYTEHLERHGKTLSAADARSLFKTNVLEPAPDLAARPAREITKTDLATIIRTVRESGRERSAGKTRAYLAAAYSLALRAEGDTEAPAAMIPFAIMHNPLTGIRAIPTRACSRVLSREELRGFIGKLGSSLVDMALKLALFAGGQRGEQLLRAKAKDFDPASGALRLLDGKGRRRQPREHWLPLGPIAAGLCQALTERAKVERPEEADPPLFGPLYRDGLTRRVAEIATEMGGAPFLFRDLRRTVETEMAALGFSTDLRAQLLSHGLGGVQAVHYDRHGYREEKKAALLRWERHLTGEEEADNVIQLATRRTA